MKLEVIARNGRRLQRLVMDLPTAASGAVDVRPESADLAEIIRFSMATAALQAATAGVRLVNDSDRPVPAVRFVLMPVVCRRALFTPAVAPGCGAFRGVGPCPCRTVPGAEEEDCGDDHED